MRVPYICLGWLMMTLGVIGVFVPLMPTTIFIILASWFFARSSPRLENWLLNHPRFGATLRSWHATGAVPRSAKLMACAGMSTGFAIFWVGAHPQPWLAGLVGAAMLASALYVVSRPAPQSASLQNSGDNQPCS